MKLNFKETRTELFKLKLLYHTGTFKFNKKNNKTFFYEDIESYYINNKLYEALFTKIFEYVRKLYDLDFYTMDLIKHVNVKVSLKYEDALDLILKLDVLDPLEFKSNLLLSPYFISNFNTLGTAHVSKYQNFSFYFDSSEIKPKGLKNNFSRFALPGILNKNRLKLNRILSELKHLNHMLNCENVKTAAFSINLINPEIKYHLDKAYELTSKEIFEKPKNDFLVNHIRQLTEDSINYFIYPHLPTPEEYTVHHPVFKIYKLTDK